MVLPVYSLPLINSPVIYWSDSWFDDTLLTDKGGSKRDTVTFSRQELILFDC